MQKETKLTFYYKYRGDSNFLLRQTKIKTIYDKCIFGFVK